jgi:hypothetical protein
MSEWCDHLAACEMCKRDGVAHSEKVKLSLCFVTGFYVVLQCLRTCDAFYISVQFLALVHCFYISVAALEVSAMQCAKLSVRDLDCSEAV